MFMFGFLLYSCTEEEMVSPMNLPSGELVLKPDGPSVSNLDAKMASACRKALEGKCFRGKFVSINPDNLRTDADIENFCLSPNVFCDRQECIDRVKVLLNRAPGGTQGDPCLP
ncbi:hypothetical protein GCM10023188_27350 [Pontibacter saemangeumensis]|uniref:Uncharacterized protein n=2 Tax=Pontibacter saemangeumensis TaxID=1084525 RepID=A0ABP8LV17_9BACT